MKYGIGCCLFIISVLIGLTGCGDSQENIVQESAGESVSEEIYNKEDSDQKLNSTDELLGPTSIENIECVFNNYTGYYGLYNVKEQKYIIEPIYEMLTDFSENGLMAACKDGYYGYINENGEVVIDFYFKNCQDFVNDYAIVSTDQGTGVIDISGNYTVQPQYEQMAWINDYVLSYRNSNEDIFGLCSRTGEVITEPLYEYFTLKNSYIWTALEKKDYYHVFTEEGQPLFGEGTDLEEVDYIVDSSFGIYPAKCHGNSDPNRLGFSYGKDTYTYNWYCYLNEDYEVAIPGPFDSIKAFNSAGYAVVETRIDWEGYSIWGVIDKDGNYICDLPELDLGRAENYYKEANGYFAIAQGVTGSYGMQTESKTALINLTSHEVLEFATIKFVPNSDITIVQDAMTGLYGMFDKSEKVFDCLYDSIEQNNQNEIVLKRGATEMIYEF